MNFGRIVGEAVCTVKYPALEGSKLLVIQPLTKELEPKGRLQVGVDVVDAGVGDLCMLARSREAALALPHTFVPVDLAVVGVIDELNVKAVTTAEIYLKEGWNNL